MEPSAEVIQQLKSKYPDRELHQVEFGENGISEVECFVMTGPNRSEYQKFVDDITKAGNAKEVDRGQAIRFAIEQNALAMIRWPERDEVKKLFDTYPAAIEKFADKLRETAGGTFELRSKKL